MEATLFSTRKLAAAAAATLALAGAGTALAGTMVVRSTGPSATAYPVGKQLATEGRITLKAGDAITVMDAGGTRVLRGPGTVAVAGSNAASGAGFAQLISNTGGRQARTGATRSAVGGGTPRSPNVWFVDASKGGTHCIADPANVTLWRPDNIAEGTVTVTRLSDNKSIDVAFRAGQASRSWPVADLPVVEGAQFRMVSPAAKAPVTVEVTVVGQPGDSLEGVAGSLLPKGCRNQMDVLVEGTMVEQPAALAAR